MVTMAYLKRVINVAAGNDASVDYVIANSEVAASTSKTKLNFACLELIRSNVAPTRSRKDAKMVVGGSGSIIHCRVFGFDSFCKKWYYSNKAPNKKPNLIKTFKK